MKTFQEFVESAKNIALDEILMISPAPTGNRPKKPTKKVEKPDPDDPDYVEKQRKYISQSIKEVADSFHYGSKDYQKKLEKERRESDQRKKEQQEKETTQARTDFHSGSIRGTKDGVWGRFYPDAVTRRYTIFRPDNQ